MMLTLAIHQQMTKQSKMRKQKMPSRSRSKANSIKQPRKTYMSKKIKDEFYKTQKEQIAAKEFLSES